QFLPIENDLAAISRAHDAESFFKVAVRKAMRDDGPDVEAGLEKNGHLVPGFVHSTSVDTLDRQHVEDHFAPVDCEFCCGKAKHSDAPAVCHVVNEVTKRLRVARHFESDVETFGHAEFLLSFGNRCLSYVQCQVDSHFARKIEAVFIDVGDD